MEMTENIVRMVRNDVAQNLAAAAKSSQKQPDPHRSNAGDKPIGVEDSTRNRQLPGNAVPRTRTVSQ